MDIYKLFFENMPWPVWVEDINKNIIFLNSLYKKEYTKWFDGKKENGVFENRLTEKYNNEIKKCIESGILRKVSGEKDNKFIECYIIPLKNENQGVKAVAGIIVDVTEKKEKYFKLKNQRNILKTIIDVLPESIFYKSNKSKFLMYNKRFKEFYKRRGVDELKGKTDMDIFSDKEVALEFIKQDKEVIAEKKSKYFECIITDENGDTRIEENLKVPVINKGGDVLGIVGLSRDITERKILEEKLRYLSYTDELTGLYNRTKFEERVKELDKEKYLPLGVIMGDVNGLKLVNDTIGHLQGDKFLKNIANILKDVCKEKGDVFRWGGDEFIILLPKCNKSQCESMIQDILNRCKNHEYEFIKLSIALGAGIRTSMSEDIYNCIESVEDKVYHQKLLESNNIKKSIIKSLRHSLELKSIETDEHIERIAKHSNEIGKKMGLSEVELEDLSLVAQLHDIGKIGIKKDILLKNSELSNEEIEIMKTHTEKGYRIINSSSELIQIANSVLTHHERWDGMGYPLGLRGKEIPILARIIAVVDTYDAMITGILHKKPISREEAIEKLKHYSGNRFDPEVVKTFITLIFQKVLTYNSNL
ncbi:sensor domain-containing diguanylate cyclase/phosphohydrolase [Clostridium chauvoei]|uniref:sensor domain-containing diguanylate cyclase/phosphohydrolase n=1 Tax=Clostridium chauvoei TaxID=46867 RepID=UPI002181EED0|nr:HD domain-containing phosphohydrolase [Clostridium chauvoei]